MDTQYWARQLSYSNTINNFLVGIPDHKNLHTRDESKVPHGSKTDHACACLACTKASSFKATSLAFSVIVFNMYIWV